jgi:hypothetical protein
VRYQQVLIAIDQLVNTLLFAAAIATRYKLRITESVAASLLRE